MTELALTAKRGARRRAPLLALAALVVAAVAAAFCIAAESSRGQGPANRPVVVEVRGGFHWLDAAVGAAAALAVVLALGAGLAVPPPSLVQAIHPSLLPRERRVDELLERRAVEQVLERPPVCRVGDHEDPLAVVAGGDLIQEVARPLDHLPVALAPGERLVDMRDAAPR